MAAHDVLATRQQQALMEVQAFLGRHHSEAAERLDRFNPQPGVAPTYLQSPDLFALHVAESMQLMADLLEPVLEDRKPRPRGRPRKADKVA